MPTLAESVAAGGRQVGPVRNDPIEIADYDPAWPARFEEMRARLAEALGSLALCIDHIGSTAVPGLPAKPVIDIQVSVPDVEDEGAYREAIEAQGFVLRWIEPGHRYFRPPPGLPRLWQVHVCTVRSEWERVHLLFRDYLRAHPAEAGQYAELKMRLAAEHRGDRIAYTDAKGPFVEEVLARADEWARASGQA
ncbi:MAG: GrpB family protein [Chloroflexota bacterium]|nr:GrpB family protein [Chloroflexota bacterium]